MSNRPGDAADLSSMTVAVIGLGLMGGSFCMAIRNKVEALLGYDDDPTTLDLARQMKLVNHLSHQPDDRLHEADVVILAVPVESIIRIVEQLSSLHSGSPVVMDLGSTKLAITNALSALPARFDPIGGHPMCGKETSSLSSAQADLYRDAPFALTVLPRTTAKAREIAIQIIQTLEAKPLFVDPATHDRWVASTSHLPFILASALSICTPQDSAALVGPGFRSSSRLASTPDRVMLDILKTNSKEVLEAIDRFKNVLDEYKDALLAENWTELGDLIDTGGELHRRLIQSTPRKAP